MAHCLHPCDECYDWNPVFASQEAGNAKSKTGNIIMIDFGAARKEMVERQILARGVRDPLVLDAMRTVPREQFLPPGEREHAYYDMPLPIGAEQTISQPYIVAFMIEALDLKGGETVLEVGTGSAYAAAVLAQIAGEVYTVERVARLAQKAVKTLSSLSYHNVHVLHRDGTLGWHEHAPYDVIIVSAGGPRVPESLKSQLEIGGRMVIPVGPALHQELVRVTRISETEYKTKVIAAVRFVPLIGDEGWDSESQMA
jgi:protein-L-isoaspartate(D-aspartate) O-methyltransferase